MAAFASYCETSLKSALGAESAAQGVGCTSNALKKSCLLHSKNLVY